MISDRFNIKDNEKESSHEKDEENEFHEEEFPFGF